MKKLFLVFGLLLFCSCKNKETKQNKMEVKIDRSVIELWEDFLANNPSFKNVTMPDSWFFCDNEKDANECAQLVVDGIKQATSTSLWWYETNNEPLPKKGDIYIITDWNGKGKAIIQTTVIEQVPYNKITQEYAEIEGEGDKSLEYWKKVHWDYYSREMKIKNEKPTEDMLIVCEQFKTIWTNTLIK
ncbi:ASCH domain-containing protein [Tenacibaculum sp. 190524A02b]|uniref:ASCH domain-containing protein n=1 Tax=Tenacibaculum vairaonense TaxID=3137860 RepID=UPI0031FA5135